jgi:GMP synthase (glutamine-hydrolysing)
VVHTPQGKEMLWNFAFKICGCSGDWAMSKFVEDTIRQVREQVGEDHVLLGLSGGVDSSVVAALLHKAIGDQLHCVYVDNGLMRHRETEEIEELFGNAFGIDLVVAREGDLFLGKLEGVADGVQRLTDNLSDINLEELIVPFTDFLKQSGPDISTILSNTAAIASQRIRAG